MLMTTIFFGTTILETNWYFIINQGGRGSHVLGGGGARATFFRQTQFFPTKPRKYMHAETLASLRQSFYFTQEKSPKNITFNYTIINFPNIYMLGMLYPYVI
jgi:hypothetical protein